jgi:hypothetical protein
MAARKRKGTLDAGGWPVQVRQRIQTSMLINRLTDHAVGKVELQPTQVKAIEILLRKTLPDLSQVSGTLEHVHRTVEELSDAELTALAAGSSAGTSTPSRRSEEPDQLH